MDIDLYIDLLKRLLGVTEAVIENTISIGALAGVLVEKEICTKEDIERLQDMTRELDKIKTTVRAIDDRRVEIEELEKDPIDTLMDLVVKPYKTEEEK